ncbi:MAG: hypothetical protein H8E70_03380 [Candidatus Marinimicrobia bacterium]|nr:hypothetical protein [Candidatus Neomarinimicrobiota bacterium]
MKKSHSKTILFSVSMLVKICFAQSDSLELQLQEFLTSNQKADIINTYVELVRLNRVQDPKLAIQYAFEGIDYFGNNKSFLLDLSQPPFVP